jgi:hypothetical protein
VKVKNQLDATKYASLLLQHVSGTKLTQHTHNFPTSHLIPPTQYLPKTRNNPYTHTQPTIHVRVPSHHRQTLYSPNHHTATHCTIKLGLTILHIFSSYGHLKAEAIYLLFSWWWAYWCPKHVEAIKLHTLSHLVGSLPYHVTFFAFFVTRGDFCLNFCSFCKCLEPVLQHKCVVKLSFLINICQCCMVSKLTFGTGIWHLNFSTPCM